MTAPRKPRAPSRPPPGRHAVGNAAQRAVPDGDDWPIDWWDEWRAGTEDPLPLPEQRKRGVAVNARTKSLRKGRALESKRGQR